MKRFYIEKLRGAVDYNVRLLRIAHTWHFGYLSGTLLTFQPSRGGMQMTPLNIHTKPIMTIARAGVRFFK